MQASSGELLAAGRSSQRAVDLAASLGAGYALGLARLHHLWQREVGAPGDPALAAQLDAALQDTRRLGLDGLALQLDWVRLLHDVADRAVPEGHLLERLQSSVDAFPVHKPGRGTWEVLGLQVVRAMRNHRPSIDASAVASLEALIARVVAQKAASLESMPARQAVFLETRRPWVAP